MIKIRLGWLLCCVIAEIDLSLKIFDSTYCGTGCFDGADCETAFIPYFPMVIENIEMSIALIFWNGKHMVMILDRDGNNGGDGGGGNAYGGDCVNIGV